MKRIFAVATLMFVAILSGCATINYGDPDRPLPPQPTVPPSIKAELVGKPLKAFRVYTGNVAYYDASPLLLKDNNGKGEWKIKSFTKEFPKLSNPSTETVVAAYQFIKVLRAHLQEEGYAVVDEPCDSCLRLDVDFATAVFHADSLNPITVIFASTRVFFNNIEVLKSSDDLMGGTKKGILESKESADNDAARITSAGFTHELERAWTIAIQGEKVSMN